MNIDGNVICYGISIVGGILALVLLASLRVQSRINDSIALRGRIERQVCKDYPRNAADIEANYTDYR